MATTHIISSSDDDSDVEMDLASRLKQQLGHQFDLTSAKAKYPPKLSDKAPDVFSEDVCFQPLEQRSLGSVEKESSSYSDNEIVDLEGPPLLPNYNNAVIQNRIETDSQSFDSSPITSSSSSNSQCEKERKASEKEAKKREREAKKEEKERLKRERQEERLKKRATKPGECNKYLSVKIDRKLVELAEGSEVASKLLSLDFKYDITDEIVPFAINFVRQDPLTGQVQTENEMVVIIPVNDFLSQVYTQIYGGSVSTAGLASDTLCHNCHKWKTLTNISNITVVVCGIDDHYRKIKGKVQRNFRENILQEKPKKRKKNDESPLSNVSRIDVETALVTAQIEHGVNARLVASPSALADLVGQVAKAIAERPHKLNRECNDFTWYAEGSSSNCVRVDKNGTGLLKLWQQQLKQYNMVGNETAQAICKEYPSPYKLIKAYRSLTAQEGERLLADIPVRRGVGVLANTRKVGIELSKKVYRFFNETDPEVYL